MEEFFVKSLEEDFVSKTLDGKNKAPFQSIESMVKTRVIKPNTKSFGRKRRLACTILSENYIKTYRPQGIIFQTRNKPDYVAPFDLVLLSNAKKIIVHYYRIKNDLHLYYNHNLIPGYEKFIFKNFADMLKEFPSPKAALKQVNNFRIKNGNGPLPREKYRLVEYNEVIFHSPVKIKPIGLFGYRPEARVMARKLGLPCFISAKEFYHSLNR